MIKRGFQQNIIVAFLMGVFFGLSWSMTASGQDDQKVRFRMKLPRNIQDRPAIPPSIDIAGQNIRQLTVDLIGGMDYFDSLKEKGYPVELLEVQPQQLDQRYLTPDKIYALIKSLAEQFPEIVETERIGDSIQGRPIFAVRLSSKQNALFKPAILFNGMHHAREVMSLEVTADIMTYLATHYNDPNTPWVTTWLDNLAIWVVPQVNPDGNTIVWTNDTWWRKNARGDGANVWGVDINRNYPFQWNFCNGSSDNREDQAYRGESPASEPETKALMHLVEEQNVAMDVSYHSYSELVIAPYGCTNEFTPEDPIIQNIGFDLAKQLRKDNGDEKDHYDYGQPWQLLYPVDGDDISWMYHDFNVMAYVIEVNAADQGFQPDYEQWRNKTVLAQRAGWQTMLHRLLTGPQVRGRMLDAKTGKPVDGNVMIANVKYTTEKPRHGKNGIYQKLLIPGSYELVFTAAGYEAQTVPISIDQGEPLSLDIFFEPVAFE